VTATAVTVGVVDVGVGVVGAELPPQASQPTESRTATTKPQAIRRIASLRDRVVENQVVRGTSAVKYSRW